MFCLDVFHDNVLYGIMKSADRRAFTIMHSLQDENIAPAALEVLREKEVEAGLVQGAASASAVMVVPVENLMEAQNAPLPVQQEMPRTSRSGRPIAKSSRYGSYVLG